MKMTRSHFQAQADLCADIILSISKRGIIHDWQIGSIVDSFCVMCARSNPKFDKFKFTVWVSNKLEGIENNL
jgi:hypothetical protein